MKTHDSIDKAALLKKIASGLCFLVLSAAPSWTQNPIVPPGHYLADPSAHVWEKEGLHVYCSVDESARYYCSWRYHVLATKDMKTWTLLQDCFASRGPNDQVAGSDALLFAPDCQYRDGIYYLYFCLPDRNYSEGVATAAGPDGPFTKGQRIDLTGHNQIDPAVFVDDDGQAYFLWGQFSAKMAKLKMNMKEIEPSTIREKVVTEEEHFFHEGAFLFKRQGIYYLVYSHMGRADTPTCIGYATSRAPMGPYTYGGVIIDNDHCDPAVWNNHGSVARFDGKWYVFYHRSTHRSRTMRKTCVEPIRFNGDGSIDEVEMTSQGAGPPLDACRTIDAERACLLFGGVHIRLESRANEELAGILSGNRAAFKYVDFDDGVTSVTVRVKPGACAGRIAVALDRPWCPAIATIEVPAAGPESRWQEITAPVEEASGVHALWLSFRGEGDRLFTLDWLRFGG